MIEYNSNGNIGDYWQGTLRFESSLALPLPRGGATQYTLEMNLDHARQNAGMPGSYFMVENDSPLLMIL